MLTHSQRKLRLPIPRLKNTPQQTQMRLRLKRHLQRTRRKKRKQRRKSQEAGSAAYLAEESDFSFGTIETIQLHSFI